MSLKVLQVICKESRTNTLQKFFNNNKKKCIRLIINGNGSLLTCYTKCDLKNYLASAAIANDDIDDGYDKVELFCKVIEQ